MSFPAGNLHPSRLGTHRQVHGLPTWHSLKDFGGSGKRFSYYINRINLMPPNSFKRDDSFLKNLAVGAAGTKATMQRLDELGFKPHCR